MKQLIFLLICSSFLYGQDNTLLWEVKGNGLKKPSYLYGTMHTKDSRAHQFGDSVLAKLSASDAVALENTYVESLGDSVVARKLASLLVMKHQTLKDLLSPEDYAYVQANANRLGDMAEAYDHVKPLITLAIAYDFNEIHEMPYTVDDFILLEGKQRGKKLFGLETMEEQFAATDEVPLKEQAEKLVKALKTEQNGSLIKLYQSQELYKMYDYDRPSVASAFDAILVDKRNKKFTKALIQLMKQQSVFCAVGALHLPGKTGLINALREKGYTVSPVISKYTPKKVYLKDERKWYYYAIDSLYLKMGFPNAPYHEKMLFELATGISKEGLNYSLRDSLTQLTFNVAVVKLPKLMLSGSSRSVYDSVIAQLEKRKNWKKVKETDDKYNGVPAKDIEFNLADGLNIRLKMVINDGKLYTPTITGFKNSLYSNVADYFFKHVILLMNYSSNNHGDLFLFSTKSRGDCYINSKNELVIPPGRYKACYTDTFKTYAIVLDDKKGLIGVDRQENFLYNVFTFDNGPDYGSDGLFRIIADGRIGYADVKTGAVIIKPQFDCAYPFENGVAKVSANCVKKQEGEHTAWSGTGWYYIDKTGKKVKAPKVK